MFQVARVAAASSAAITYLLTTSFAFAHHPGGLGNTQGAGPVNTISASTLEEGRGVAGFILDYTSLETLSDATLSALPKPALRMCTDWIPSRTSD